MGILQNIFCSQDFAESYLELLAYQINEECSGFGGTDFLLYSTELHVSIFVFLTPQILIQLRVSK